LDRAVKIINAQSLALFELASGKLGSLYRHERGDKILTAYGLRGILGQAVFSGIAVGMKAELGIWFERDRGLAGRRFLQAVFHVPFVEWNCIRVTAATRLSNVRAQIALTQMGFKFEAQLEAWFGDEPGLMYRMLRDECAWLKGRQ
jgi:RimJ/RimL family protein N-acetyltransferase